MKNIIWYEILTGKVVQEMSTGTDAEDVRPAYDRDNDPYLLAYAEVALDTNAGAYYDAETQTVSYITQTDPTNTVENKIRQIRNSRLFKSDWTQIPDAPLAAEKKIEWATYRQALRDLPDTNSSTSIEQVIFPTPPSN